MPLQCRTCCGAIYNMKARNLFDSDNRDILIKVTMVTGTALDNSSQLPSHICACCLLDLNRAIHHIEIFRERCSKAQERFTYLSTRNDINSDDDIIDNVKEETDVKQEECDLSEIESILFEEDDNVNNITSTYVDQSSQDADSLVTSVRNEMNAFSTDSQSSEEDLSDTVNKSSTSLDADVPNKNVQETNAIENTEKRKYNLKFTHLNDTQLVNKQRQPYKSWKNLTEQQTIERKRQQRRRDCICDQCGRRFTDQSNFKLHLLRHTGVKDFKCKHCSKEFYTDHLLQLHDRIVHHGERPYACKFCKKKFNNSTSRVLHERSHNNIRPYSCKYCDKTFISASDLKRHDLIHNGIRNYSCTLCNKTFQRSTHLTAHFRSKVHKLKKSNIDLIKDVE